MSGLEEWFAYISDCVGAPMQAPVCQQFWIWTMIASFAISVLILVTIVWKVSSHILKRAAAIRERNRVDSAAIAERQWDGDKAYHAELGSEEVEQRIRQAVEERRPEKAPPYPELTLTDRQR